MLKRTLIFTRGLIALSLLMALALAPVNSYAADQDPTGTWNIVVDMAGQEITATMTVTKNADGSYNGSLSSAMGDAEFDSVEFSGSDLSFTQTFGEGPDAIEFKFEGKLDGDTFAGMLNSDMGEMAVKGTRATAAGIFGTWNLVSNSENGEMEHTLVLNDNLTGTVDGNDIEDLVVSADEISFTIGLTIDGESMEFEVEGTIDGNSLTGEAYLNGDSASDLEGEMASASSGSAGSPFGTWAIESSSEFGDMEHTLVLNHDLSGSLDGNTITDLTLSADEISFEITMTVDGETMDLEIDGSIDGKEISGEAYLNGDSVADLEGTMTAGAAAGGSSASAVFGTWTIDSSSEAGDQEHTMILNADLSGTFDGQTIESLTVSTDEISFEVSLTIDGETMDFEVDASIDGGEFSGEAYLNGDSVADLEGAQKNGTTSSNETGPFGTWAVESSSEVGDQEHTLVLNQDLTGTVDGIAMEDVVVSADELSYSMTITIDGETMDLEIEVTFDGDELSGEAYLNGDSIADLEGEKA